jgi:hypothetical protein
MPFDHLVMFFVHNLWNAQNTVADDGGDGRALL